MYPEIRLFELISEVFTSILYRLSKILFLLGANNPSNLNYYFNRGFYIKKVLKNEKLFNIFVNNDQLSEGFGLGLDERCVEYPWALSRKDDNSKKIFDAGSTLNHRYVLENKYFQNKNFHLMTLAPERRNYWYRGYSYLYGDLKDTPYGDNYFDRIFCISTLEHVGYDHSLYSDSGNEGVFDEKEYKKVVIELRRILKPKGKLLITVPYGKPLINFNQKIFDSDSVKSILQLFGGNSSEIWYYKYTSGGWQLSDETSCKDAEYVKWGSTIMAERPKEFPKQNDLAVAARSVVCIELVK